MSYSVGMTVFCSTPSGGCYVCTIERVSTASVWAGGKRYSRATGDEHGGACVLLAASSKAALAAERTAERSQVADLLDQLSRMPPKAAALAHLKAALKAMS